MIDIQITPAQIFFWPTRFVSGYGTEETSRVDGTEMYKDSVLESTQTRRLGFKRHLEILAWSPNSLMSMRSVRRFVSKYLKNLDSSNIFARSATAVGRGSEWYFQCPRLFFNPSGTRVQWIGVLAITKRRKEKFPIVYFALKIKNPRASEINSLDNTFWRHRLLKWCTQLALCICSSLWCTWYGKFKLWFG